MPVQAQKTYTLKFYLKGHRRPIELEGMTQAQIDEFPVIATTSMFVKYGPVLIRTESIDYVVIQHD